MVADAWHAARYYFKWCLPVPSGELEAFDLGLNTSMGDIHHLLVWLRANLRNHLRWHHCRRGRQIGTTRQQGSEIGRLGRLAALRTNCGAPRISNVHPGLRTAASRRLEIRAPVSASIVVPLPAKYRPPDHLRLAIRARRAGRWESKRGSDAYRG